MTRGKRRRRGFYLVLCYVSLVAATLCFRADAAKVLSFDRALREGLVIGVLNDFLVGALPHWSYYFLKTLHERIALIVATTLSLVIVSGAAASAIFFRMNGTPLDFYEQSPALLQTILKDNDFLVGIWLPMGFLFSFIALGLHVWLLISIKVERYLFRPPSTLGWWILPALWWLVVLTAAWKLREIPHSHPERVAKFLGLPKDALKQVSPASKHFLFP